MQREGFTLHELPANQAILLDNQTCVYCGVNLANAASTKDKDHVIARRFVPRSKLNAQWNLIVRACKDCNTMKSNLEDDISAISMCSDASGQHVQPDPVLASEATRKARKSLSRRTGKPVEDSSEQVTLKVQIAPKIQMAFHLTSPPQMDPKRVAELSRLQLMAFFYWMTYDKARKRGGYWPGTFFPVQIAAKSDWGNGVQKAFMESVLTWQPRVLVTTAGGFFKIAVRRHLSEVCWSWALEWNQNYRIIGFLGESEAAEKHACALPVLEAKTISQSSGYRVKYRKEIRLAQEDDTLFQ